MVLQLNKHQRIQVCTTEFSSRNETIIEIRFPHNIKKFCSLERPVEIYLMSKNKTTLIGAMIAPVFFQPTFWEGIKVDFGEITDVNVAFRGIWKDRLVLKVLFINT